MEIIINPKDVPIPSEIRNKWQNIVNILTRVMNVPVALIMKVDFPSFTVFQSAESQGNPFKANQEFMLPAGIYCEKTMRGKGTNIIPNALKDPEWNKNPSIAAGLISYIGVPIFYPNKSVFGTLCVLDNKENAFSKDFEEVLGQFKDIVESHLALLWQNLHLERMLEQQKYTEKQLMEKIQVIKEIDQIYVNRQLEVIELKKQIAILEEALKKARGR